MKTNTVTFFVGIALLVLTLVLNIADVKIGDFPLYNVAAGLFAVNWLVSFLNTQK